MSRVRYEILMNCRNIVKELIRNKIVSAVSIKENTIVARYGVNKTTLKKILKKELKGGD